MNNFMSDRHKLNPSGIMPIVSVIISKLHETPYDHL